MYEVLQRRLETEGQDQQERLMLSMNTMMPREKGHAIGQFVQRWLSPDSCRSGAWIV